VLHVTVFEVTVMPGTTGVLNESADVAVAVAVVTFSRQV
jgi:hypothetical protein